MAPDVAAPAPRFLEGLGAELLSMASWIFASPSSRVNWLSECGPASANARSSAMFAAPASPALLASLARASSEGMALPEGLGAPSSSIARVASSSMAACSSRRESPSVESVVKISAFRVVSGILFMGQRAQFRQFSGLHHAIYVQQDFHFALYLGHSQQVGSGSSRSKVRSVLNVAGNNVQHVRHRVHHDSHRHLGALIFHLNHDDARDRGGLRRTHPEFRA